MSVRKLGFLIAFLALISDQITKYWILSIADLPYKIAPFFNLVLAYNKGVSFGFLSNSFAATRWLLIAFALGVCVVLGIWLYKRPSKKEAIALGLLLGGALGNITDRFRLGAVVDFLDFHLDSYHWPAFNIADTAITIGIGILLFFSTTRKT